MEGLVLILLLISGAICDEVRMTFSDEKRAIKHLLENYERVGSIGSPTSNSSDTVRVYFGVALIQTLGIDDKAETAKLKLWLRHTWNDMFLQWDPASFGGVSSVIIPASKIWNPDIVLFNGKTEEIHEAMAIVYSNGDVLWVRAFEVEITCSLDLTNFPNDQQVCALKYASWTHNGFKLDPHFYEGLEGMDLSDYFMNNEWSLLDAPAVKNEKYYPCCPEPYPDLTFFLRIKRNPTFYNFVVIIPGVLLSSLTLLIFLMPPNSSDRNSYAIAIFAAFTLLLVIIAEVIPRGMVVIPVFARYLMANLLLVVLAKFLSTFVTSMYAYSGKRRLPLRLERIVFRTTCGRATSERNNANIKNGPECVQLRSQDDPDAIKEEEYGGWKRLARIVDGILFVLFLITEIILFCLYVL